MMRHLLALFALVVCAVAMADDCGQCADKSAKATCCAEKNGVKCSGCTKGLDAKCPDTRERAFWAMATQMMGEAPAMGKASCGSGGCGDSKTAKAEECCKSTAAKKVAKGGEGCCNAPKSMAKFKVWAGGQYFFYGCEGSAAKGRDVLVQRGMIAGQVQTVQSRISL